MVDGRATGFCDSAKKLGIYFFADAFEVSGVFLEEVFDLVIENICRFVSYLRNELYPLSYHGG